MHELGRKMEALGRKSPAELRSLWRETFKQAAPDLNPDLMSRAIAYRWQERQHGGLPTSTTCEIARLTRLLVRTGTLESAGELSLKPGTRWSGPRFFGLTKRKAPPAKRAPADA